MSRAMYVSLCAAAVAFGVMLGMCDQAGADVGARIDIVDGDTIKMNGASYRLHGFDAPERGQRCTDGYPAGVVATQKLASILNGQELRCRIVTHDRYNRIVARCFAGDIDVGSAMVASGAAYASRKYSSAYVGDEDRARERKRGVWAHEGCQLPWEYRKDR